MPLTFVLLRVEAAEAAAGGGGDVHSYDEAVRSVFAITNEIVPARCVVGRSAPNELVLVLRTSPDAAVGTIERIRLRVERARADGNGDGAASVAITAAVLAVPNIGIIAPETILCALGEQGRRALADVRNSVVGLPPLDAS